MADTLKNTIGLDISSGALVAVKMTADRNGVRVSNYSRVDLEPEVVEDDSIVVNADVFKASIQKLLKEGKNGPFFERKVVIAVPEAKTFSHQVSVPAERAWDADYLLGVAKDYIPIELGDAIVDYRPVKGPSEERHVTFEFVAIQKSLVESIVALLQESGVNVVAVDVGKDSLIRCCEFAPGMIDRSKQEDLMVVNIEEDETFFYAKVLNDGTFTLNSNLGGRKMVDLARQALSIPTNAEARQALLGKGGDKIGGAQLLGATREQISVWVQKAQELRRLVEAQKPFRLGHIFVLGPFACMPGVKEAFTAAFPELKVSVGLPENLIPESHDGFARAMGLALRAVIPGAHDECANLLPAERKEEAEGNRLRPMIIRGLLGISVVTMGFAVAAGMYMTNHLLGKRIAAQELSLSREKIENPYLNKVAQASQLKSRLEGEISTLLRDALPLNVLLEKVDSYNKDGIGLVTVNFYVDSVGALVLRLQAKSDSRERTEQFLVQLEGEPFFSNMVSPLSNLVGKGVRFINIDLNVNAEKIISAYRKSNAPQESAGGVEEAQAPGSGEGSAPLPTPQDSTTETPSDSSVPPNPKP